MQDGDFDKLVKGLLGDTPPRVWSLLVTMFGDLALAKEARLSGACVNALTAAIGIKPEATRVALHRLRKEGWIDSHRTGRQSHYALTDMGRAETEAARPRVYASTSPQNTPKLVLDDPSRAMDPESKSRTDHLVRIAPHCVVTTSGTHAETHWAMPVSLEAGIPQWVADKLCPPEIQKTSQTLARRYSKITETRGLNMLNIVQKSALRVAIVHEWRRLVLRVPNFPDTLLSDAWHGPACRTHLAELLNALSRPDLAELETYVSDG